MAVLSIDELKEEGARTAHWDLQSGRSYTRKWRAITSTVNDGPNVVLTAFGRKYGDKYVADYNASEKDNCYCDSIDIQQEGDDGLGWIVALSYSRWNPNQTGGGPDDNPLLMPIEVSWDLRDHELPLTRDINGKAVLNTAGDPFDPPVVIDDPRLLMTVVRNEATFNLGWVVQYRNAINSDPFGGFDPYYSKVMNISARNLWHQDAGWYYQVTYQFEFITPKVNDITTGFRYQILSQGYRAISSVSGKVYHIVKQGIPINSPALLDKSGFTLGLNADPYFIDVPAYPELPFSQFGFDPAAISGQRSGPNYAPAPPAH